MNDTIGNRIKSLREQSKLSQGQISIKTQKSRSLVALWEQDKRMPNKEDLVKLANIFGVSTDYILGVDKNIDLDMPRLNVMKDKVKVYGRIPAGTPFEAIEERMEDLDIPNKFAKKKDLFGLKIEGESMNKKIPNGAIGLFEKCDTLENGEIGAIMVNGFDATVKKFYRLTDSVILEPLSYDEGYEPMVIKNGTEEVRIIGKLLWVSVDL